MSDYKPITGDLRKYAKVACDLWPSARRDRLYQLCDAIDAVHAQLEEENERLHRELRDRPIAVGADAAKTIARLEWENAALKAERDGLVELPKDADGEAIHVGDMLAGEKAGGLGLCEPFEVGSIVFYKDGITAVYDSRNLGRCAEFAHHYQPDTWERIIADACGGTASEQSLIARCKALCERTRGGDAE